LRLLIDKEGGCYADFARKVRLFGEVRGVCGMILGKRRFGRLVIAAACFAMATLSSLSSGVRWGLLGARFGV
jgi:hypothetical protein